MKIITLTRITASAWDGTERVGYTYVDFPTDWPEYLVRLMTREVATSVRKMHPGRDIVTETEEIAWSA